MLRRIFRDLFLPEEKKETPTSFFIDPNDYPIKIEIKLGEMYREAKADLLNRMVNGRDPNPTTEVGLWNVFSVARMFNNLDWELVANKQDLGDFNKQRRADVLNVLRLWWTEAQHIANDGQPMYVHLLADEGWED